MAWQNNDIRLEIKAGRMKESEGWIVQNDCQHWKRNDMWWAGSDDFKGGCFEWDYACQRSCMGSNWEYALVLSTKKSEGLLVLTTFDPYAVANTDYYSVSNNIARSNFCHAQCQAHPESQSDCAFYCSNLSYIDSSIHTDIAMGNKNAAQGWYPQS